MIVTAWILLVIFGLTIISILNSGINNNSDAIFFVFCVFTVATSAGIIWGGLFSQYIKTIN